MGRVGLERRIAFERLVSTVCSRLAQADAETMDESLGRSLEEIGLFVGADRAYLFQFRGDGARVDSTHEWCAEGIAPQIDNLQGIDLGRELPWFAREIQQGDTVSIPRVGDLPDEMERERRHFEGQGIQSLLIAPMATSDGLAGFLGFDAVGSARDWVPDDRILLKFVADAMAGALKRIRAERRLSESEAKYRSLFDLSPVGIVVLDPETTRPLDFNDTAHLQLGYSREEFARLTLADIDAVETHEETRERIERILRGERCEFETKHRTRSGEIRDVHVTAQYVMVAGRPIFHCMWRDISPRKRAEEELRNNLALMTSLLDSIPDLIFFKTQEGVYLGCNTEFALHVGKTREEIIGKTDYDLYDKQSADAFRANDRLMLQQGSPRRNEDWISYPDGRKVRIDTLKAPFFAGDGKLLGLIGVSRDITKQREAETRLRLQSLVLDQIQDCVTVTDLAGVITYVNEAEVQLLGYSRDELIGAATEKYGEDPVRGATQRQIIQETLKHGEWRGEVVNLTTSGEEVILDCRTQVVLDEHGNRVALAGISADITERKRMETELREREHRLALALETAQLGYWKWTAASNRVEWYGNHHLLFGIRQEEFEGTLDHVQRCIHPDDRQMGLDNIQRAFKERVPFNNTYRVVHPDGSIRWLNSFGRLRYDEEGQPESMFGITRDISEFKFSQREAEERVAQLTALLNCMQRGVLVEDTERRLLFANQDFCDIFGLPHPDTILGANCQKAAEAVASLFADPEGFLRNIDVRLAAGEPVLNERLELIDGRILERTYAPVRMGERPFGHLWVYRDKTKEVRIEQKIARAKEEWENTFDAVSDMICILDEDHRIRRANRALAARLGKSPEDLVGMFCCESVHKREEPPVFCPHSKTLEDKAEHTVEITDSVLGSEVVVTTTPLTDASGKLTGSVFVARDMTERNAVERRLRIMGGMLDLAPCSITVHDTDGNFLYANRKTFAMHGYDAEEFLCVSLRDLDVPESRGLMEGRIRQIAEQGEAIFEVEHYRKDGTTFPLEVLAKSVEWQDRPAILSIAADVSDRKRLEKERLEMERRIQHAQKLESLGVLAGGIAHDFNNLLMSILGHADLALDELTPTSPARANIEQIETASRRAAELCAQMLAYAGRGRFVVEPFDVSTLIDEMAHLLKASISKKAILNLRAEKDLPKVKGDATQLRQVVMNLVINASEAIGERPGAISISTGVCQCRAEDLQGALYEGNPPEGSYVFIEVADTGCGMDRETLDRLFEPFFTTKFAGRGLGMSAVLGIVRGHHGILKVHTELGRGTTFRILLPPSVDAAQGESRARKSPLEARVPGARILLVEDEESVRTLGQRMLERIGFQVTTASDGREALAVYEREGKSIDLVVLDLTMPRMGGEETLRELQRINPAVRIVMASGYSNYELEARLTGQGLLGFIQKPYTMAQLKERLYPLFEQ